MILLCVAPYVRLKVASICNRKLLDFYCDGRPGGNRPLVKQPLATPQHQDMQSVGRMKLITERISYSGRAGEADGNYTIAPSIRDVPTRKAGIEHRASVHKITTL